MSHKPQRAQPINRGGERDPDRFYCPYPNCTRSFAELWRLKVHYRAPPDARGSGKERGHGCELQFCPKCDKELKAGKHHVGCFAGKAGPRQAAKRLKAQEEAAQAESAAAMDFSRRRSAPVGEAWRPLARDDFAAAKDCGPSYQTCLQSKSRGASSQDSEGSQPQEPSQKRRRTVLDRHLPGSEGGAQLMRVHSSSLADLHQQLVGVEEAAAGAAASCAIAFPLDLVELAEPAPSTSGSEGTTGGHLQRTISAPPLASVQIGRPVRDCLFEFTSIFDGDAFADSPPPAHKRPGAGGMCSIQATSASDVSNVHELMINDSKPRLKQALLELPSFGSLHDDHIMQAMFAELAEERPPPPPLHHRRCMSAHAAQQQQQQPASWDQQQRGDQRPDLHGLDAQIAREAHLACAHSAPRAGGRGGPATPPMSPSAGGHLPLDALLMGFSASSAGGGESSPEHTGPQRGTPLDGGPLAGLPPFPNFGDDLNFIQDARYGWHDKRSILAPPEHPYFSLEAYSTHKHMAEASGQMAHKYSHSPLTPEALRHPSESESRRWSPLSEQTQAMSFRH